MAWIRCQAVVNSWSHGQVAAIPESAVPAAGEAGVKGAAVQCRLGFGEVTAAVTLPPPPFPARGDLAQCRHAVGSDTTGPNSSRWSTCYWASETPLAEME